MSHFKKPHLCILHIATKTNEREKVLPLYGGGGGAETNRWMILPAHLNTPASLHPS